jgi:PAS domain S-box-containing protein
MDSILDTAPCGFLSFTDDGTVRSVNQTLLDLLGRSRTAVVGDHVESLLSSGAKLFYHTHFFPMLKMQEEVEEVYMSLETSDGDALSFLLNAERTPRDGETVNEMVLLPFEERNQYEDEILQAKQVAEQANRAKAKFLSTVSHELRTPISTIKSLSQYLSLGVRGPVTEEQEEYLDRIDAAADYLDTLITDILDFARMEAGSVDVSLDSVSVEGALNRAESLVEVRFDEADLTYERTLPFSDLYVEADPDRLQQILLNLLTNAVKFTGGGGSVTTEVAVEDDMAQICVRDTGIGISEDDQRHIFDPFIQARDPEASTQSGGVGLGLAISRDLTEAMGGTLTVESEEGTGSVFTVSLPISNSSEVERQ